MLKKISYSGAVIIAFVVFFSIIKLAIDYNSGKCTFGKININNYSFESWVKSTNGKLIPKSFSFQDSEALIERSNIAKEGKYSVLMKQASKNGSFLRYQVDGLKKYKGKRIKLSAWIKSAYKAPAAIDIDMQDGIHPVNVVTYPVNGEWQRVELIGEIDSNAGHLLITFNPLDANRALYVDDIKLEVISLDNVLSTIVLLMLLIGISYLIFLKKRYLLDILDGSSTLISKIPFLGYFKKLPIIAFFFYLFYLCIIFHSKTPTMADFLVTFDNLWFFFHQLQQGVFPQWNPFSLLGRVATNWNQIPVSIFTPFFLFRDFNLFDYKIINICGTFILYVALYLSGRIAGYGRFLPLIPLLIFLSPGRYTSIASMFIFFNQLTFLPLALAYFISITQENNIPFRKGLLAIMLFTLSFIGVRFENMVHALGVIILLFTFMAFSQLKNPRNTVNVLLWGFASVGFIVVANIWQLTVLLNVIFTNFRISIQFKPSLFCDNLFWKWIFKGLIYQAPLVFFFGNVFLCRLLKLFRKDFPTKHMPFLFAIVIIIGEFFLVRAMYSLETIGFNYAWLCMRDSMFILNRTLRLELYGVVAPTIAITLFRIFLKKPFTIGEFFLQIAYFWAGAYIAQITNIFWYGLYPALPFWLDAILYIFLPLGCYRFAVAKKRAWLVWVVIAYYFIGETGVFFLNEIIGIPWFSIRANVYLAPLVAILILEGMSYLVKSLIYLLQKPPFIFEPVISSRIVNISAGVVILIVAFITVRSVFLPVAGGDYLGLWPFSTTPIKEVEKNIFNPNTYENSAIYEPHMNSLAVRSKKINRLKRIDPAVAILPSFSQRYNFSYLYNNDISKDLVRMFFECYNENLTIHPEHLFQQHYLQYKKEEAERKNIPLNKDYTGTATLTIDKNKNKLYPQLLALEEADSQRIFISDKIAKFTSYEEEYLYLKNNAENNLPLSTVVTTSDVSFGPNVVATSLDKLEYSIEIKKDAPEKIKLNVFSNKDAYLVMLDLYHAGWKAFIDNKETRIFKAYIGTRGIVLPAGKHIVEFRFSIPYFIPGIFVSFFAWICLLFVYAASIKKSVKRV